MSFSKIKGYIRDMGEMVIELLHTIYSLLRVIWAIMVSWFNGPNENVVKVGDEIIDNDGEVHTLWDEYKIDVEGIEPDEAMEALEDKVEKMKKCRAKIRNSGLYTTIYLNLDTLDPGRDERHRISSVDTNICVVDGQQTFIKCIAQTPQGDITLVPEKGVAENSTEKFFPINPMIWTTKEAKREITLYSQTYTSKTVTIYGKTRDPCVDVLFKAEVYLTTTIVKKTKRGFMKQASVIVVIIRPEDDDIIMGALCKCRGVPFVVFDVISLMEGKVSAIAAASCVQHETKYNLDYINE